MSDDYKKEQMITDSAVAQFLAEEFKYGDVISHEWLKTYLKIPSPKELSDVQRVQFLLLSRVEDFKRLLLEEHKLALESVRGTGYRIVPPNDQAAFAVTEAAKLIQKGIDKGLELLEFARQDEMDETARKRHIDAHIKMASLQQIAAKKRQSVFALFDESKQAERH